MLYKSSTHKFIIGSPDGMTIGEAFVPGALPEPAKPCSPTPSTRPDDLNLIYIQPRKQKKPSIESFPTTTKVVVTSNLVSNRKRSRRSRWCAGDFVNNVGCAVCELRFANL